MAKFNYSKRVPADGTDAVGAILKAAADPSIISFAGGLPAPELFPVEAMKKATDAAYDEHGREVMQYGAARGVKEMRELVLQIVKDHENVVANDENVVVTNGSEQVLELAAKALVNEVDTVLVEDPTYLCAVDAFKSYGANLVGVPTDEDGLIPSELEKTLQAHPEAKFLYVIPTFQNPTGRTMPAERRQQVAELAAKYNLLVFEDNPYGDIRFEGEHVDAIKSYDKSGNVVYMGTFSKILSPGFRLGYLVADPEFVQKFTLLKQTADLGTNNLVQWATVKFYEQNNVDEHVKKISDLYGQRKALMEAGMKKYFPAGVTYTHPEGGMFLWVTVPGVDDTTELFKQCLEEKVAFVPGEPFYAGQPEPGHLRLNYSNMAEDQIDEGLKRLGKALANAIK
ncbi:PLP-dependent aminotransferase family protein [Limosilactobacillus equigenerosi]|uniref:Transcriptional regulator n=1 Tax=Limosilactobacillus equigenerosi DSM 18793 = JCM 14505 TaxID=1423742 RepID=A0A0R1UMQ9_9LACO|nr:PLP-dependent aminotransferase family protein [Limosilactobacillus equigenerosi]KRL92245.1 Transcriptional regulator [Limosilactobacillus equigenerosi DSM 18793 = JCM 14505]